MNQIKVYEKLTYIECYDWKVVITPTPKETVKALRKSADRFIDLWNQLIAIWNIKNVEEKVLSPVEQIVYSIEDKFIRDRLKADIDKRNEAWMRINVEIVQNLLAKYEW